MDDLKIKGRITEILEGGKVLRQDLFRELKSTEFRVSGRKFGVNLRSKTNTAQVNEILCKVLAHNICVLIQEMNELKIRIKSF